jgi:hypothetical protein
MLRKNASATVQLHSSDRHNLPESDWKFQADALAINGLGWWWLIRGFGEHAQSGRQPVTTLFYEVARIAV